MAARQQSLALQAFVALGLAISSFTSFRFGELPIGFSEVIITTCILLHLPLGLGIYPDNRPRGLVVFIALTFLLTLPGYFTTLAVEGLIPSATHSLLASIYVLVVIAYLHFGFNYSRVKLDNLLKLFIAFSTVYFLVAITLAFVDPTSVYIRGDIEDLLAQRTDGSNEDAGIYIRLAGFSTNPNQLALHALIVLFFSVYLFRKTSLLGSIVTIGIAGFTGFMTGSDAFMFGAAAFGLSTIGLQIMFHTSVLTTILLFSPAVLIGLNFVGPALIHLQDVIQSQDQDLTRFTLWRNGIEAGLERPLIGLGPGAWSGYEVTGQSAGSKLGAELEEAHNTLIDHFSNSGIIGALVLIVG